MFAHTDGEGRVIETIDEAWIHQYGSMHSDDPRSRDRVLAYGRMLGRLAGPGAAVVAPSDAGGAVALGFAVAERGWAGIFGMGTRPEARRKGAASAVLHTLATWAAEQHAPRLYLQVEVDNAPARSLYTGAGFVDAYRYHYRTRSA